MWTNVQLMLPVLTLREVMNVAAILDSLEMAKHVVCGLMFFSPAIIYVTICIHAYCRRSTQNAIFFKIRNVLLSIQ